MRKRFMSVILAFCMIVSSVPTIEVSAIASIIDKNKFQTELSAAIAGGIKKVAISKNIPDGVQKREIGDNVAEYTNGDTFFISPENPADEVYLPADSSELFCKITTSSEGNLNGLRPLTEINLNGLKTANTEDVTEMFRGCTELQKIDLSGWDTSNIECMRDMFYGCKKVGEIIGLSEWNTEKVTDMSFMFRECHELTNLNLSGWDTKNVQNMSYMFLECTKLQTVNLNGWDTKNVTSMMCMFNRCEDIRGILGLDSWNTKNVKDLGSMFYQCKKLQCIDLGKWSTENIKDLTNMFDGCSELKKVNLCNWDTCSVERWWAMFLGCNKLECVCCSKNLWEKFIDKNPTNTIEDTKNGSKVQISLGNTKLRSEAKCHHWNDSNKCTACGANKDCLVHMWNRKGKCIICGKSNVEVKCNSFAFKSDIGINFYVSVIDKSVVDKFLFYDESGKIIYSIPLDECDTQIVDGVECYKLTYKVPAKQMTDKVTLKYATKEKEEVVTEVTKDPPQTVTTEKPTQPTTSDKNVTETPKEEKSLFDSQIFVLDDNSTESAKSETEAKENPKTEEVRVANTELSTETDSETGEIELQKYSVHDYAIAVILGNVKVKVEEEEFKKFCAAMLNYGAAAQRLFNYKLDNLADKDLPKQYTDFPLPAVYEKIFENYKVKQKGIQEKVVLKGTTLELNTETTLNLWFEVSAGGCLPDPKIKYHDGKPIGPERIEVRKRERDKKSYQVISIKEIAATDLGNVIGVTVGGLTIELSPLEYPARAFEYDKSTEVLKDLSCRLYDYYKAADGYFRAN